MALYLALCLCVYLLFTQSAEGSIDDFDCVEIYKQPAFQHPLLKNHKIQKTFSSYAPERSNNYETKEQCPKGTVAILKQRNGSESFHLNSNEHFGQHFATMDVMLDGIIYRGAEAEISVHALNLQDNQYSKSQIWLENGPPGQLNSIQAGWAVHPRLYGDNVTRFTIYWTGDGYGKTGCYNTDCPGFVVLSRNPYIGSKFAGSSVYGKVSRYFTLQIFQDASNGNWGLKVGDEVIGYWPKELFTELNKGASLVRYGGNTFMSTDRMSPPMGNGQFPNQDFLKAAHFKNVLIIDSNYKKVRVEENQLNRNNDAMECFKAKFWFYNQSSGDSFSFGGPGGDCGDCASC